MSLEGGSFLSLHSIDYGLKSPKPSEIEEVGAFKHSIVPFVSCWENRFAQSLKNATMNRKIVVQGWFVWQTKV